MERFPIQLAIEVTGRSHDADADHIVLIAYIGSDNQELASTDQMTGYQATQDPVRCLRLLLLDALGLKEDLTPIKPPPISNDQVRQALGPFVPRES